MLKFRGKEEIWRVGFVSQINDRQKTVNLLPFVSKKTFSNVCLRISNDVTSNKG